MAIDHYPIDEDLDNLLETLNIIIANLFALEMFLKHLGLGFRNYWRDAFNFFDGTLVILSYVEYFLSGYNIGGLIVLRAFRLLRVFKLAKSWKSLRQLINTVVKSMTSISYLGLLMLLFVFIYALMGMQFFGNRWVDEVQSSPRINFDTFWWSLVGIFIVLTGENWNELMYQAVDYEKSGFGPVCYFVSLFVLGNYILLNLFLAILLSNF